MKRYAATILSLVLLISSAGSSYTYGATTVSRGNATGHLNGVKYSSDGSNEAVTIAAKNYTDYNVMELSDPKRIVLDIYNATAPGKQQIVQAGGNNISRIRYAQFDSYTARVVLELNHEVEYGVEKTDTGLVFYIGEKPSSEKQGEQTTTTQSNAQETIPTPSTTSTAVKKTITVHSKFEIQYTSGELEEEVEILLSSYAKYTVKRLTDPNRLVITIPNALYTSVTKQINVNGNQIKTIQYVKSGKSGASITLSLNAQSQYNIKETKDKLTLTVQQPAYKNIAYHNQGDRVYFTLRNAVLTEGDEFLEELYTGTYDHSEEKYTVTFPTGQADLGNGIMKINDSYLQSIQVMTNLQEGTTSLIFNGTGKNAYLAYTRGSSGVSSITVLKPATNEQKLVVIDAGHGGMATGAIYRKIMEKELNLDIAKRLNKLLEKKGVKTYMLREDDSDIANYERAYIANKLNARLYLSIHNNAMDDKNYRGTMTLYCPSSSRSSFTGKGFADIIHNKLLGALKTVNRKVIDRPDLIVLKATMMPAALAEVAFMTNSIDRSNLQKTTFRQKAAQALCDGVVKALAKVK